MTDEQAQFDGLLSNILSTDNDLRTQAEQAFDNIPVETRILFLLNTVSNQSNGEEVRQLAAVLMRRLISSEFEEFYQKLSEETKQRLKEQLLLAVTHETGSHLRRKICDTVSEFARNLIDDEGNNLWPEFLKFLFDCASSPNPVMKEAALHMFCSVPGIFGNQQNRYLDVIKQMLVQSLQDTTNVEVCNNAVKATASFLLAHEKENQVQRHLADCLPLMLKVLSLRLESCEDDVVLKSFVDLAESCPRFLRGQLEPLLFMLTKTIAQENMPDSWKHLALEFIVTLSETAPAMVRKLGQKHITDLVPLILAMMVDLDDDPEWALADNVDDEEDSESNPVIGESSLDRLACALGGKVVLPLVTRCLPDLFHSENWMHRYAALMAVSSIGEGCHRQMEGMLGEIVPGVLRYLEDPHPRVRYAACNALGQMATDFSPIFEKKFHDRVIPGLIRLFEDYSNPRVQAHAGAALVNFLEECTKSILTPYLDIITTKLEAVLSTKFKELVEKGTKHVLEQVVVTLASVADTAEEKFVQYYDRFMPCLKYIVQNATTTELRLLRGKTIECISLIGLAVGKEKFVPDASEVMDVLLKTQIDGGAIISDDDPQLGYMISAWARICKILGKQFEPYLPYVMGPVLKAASLKPEVALLDTDDMKAIEGDDAWHFVSLGEQQNFGIKTAGLEDKATACQMLVCYARELKEGFAPYVEEVAKLMVSLLKFFFHEGVRTAATEALPCLLECAKIRGDAYVQDMWRFIWPELLSALDNEPEADVLAEHMHSLAQCIEILGRGCLEGQASAELMRVLDKNMQEHFKRAQERHEKRQDEDYDEMVEQDLLQEDDVDIILLLRVSDILHSAFYVYKAEFLPCFEPLLPHFVRLLGADRTLYEQQWGLCIFDDVIEHSGPNCAKYRECFLPPLISSLVSKGPEVRQAAAYGIGVLAQFAGDQFAKECADVMPVLVQVITHPESRSPENINATENAISAATKILAYNNSMLNTNEYLPLWFSWLPVWEDLEETPHVYGFLCTMLEQNNPIILGKDNCNLPRIVMVMAEVFVHESITADSDVGKRMIALLANLKSNVAMFSACTNQLTTEQQEVLNGILP